MKKSYLLICLALLLVLTGIVSAQIPNAGFQDWTAGEPNGWNTSNGLTPNITQTSDARTGGSALHGVVATFGGGFPWPPVIISGPNAEGFPVSTQHPALHGWYKFSPLGSDQFFVTVGMSHADTAVGGSAILLPTPENVYREFVANIFYISAQAPDTCFISATITNAGGFPVIGSAFDMDDLAFGPAVSVDEKGNVIPDVYELHQNYPNPFNPRTMIQYAIPKASRVSLIVYNMLGEEAATLVNGLQDAGVYRAEFDGTNLPSGTYFYRLQAGEFSEVKKLTLLK